MAKETHALSALGLIAIQQQQREMNASLQQLFKVILADAGLSQSDGWAFDLNTNTFVRDVPDVVDTPDISPAQVRDA